MTSDDETKALKPTSKEINAVIADMVGVGPLTPGDPDVPLCVPLVCHCLGSTRQEARHRGRYTLACAAAAAWVLSHDEIADQFGRVPLSLRDFNRVPRHVLDDWTFEIENVPKEARL